MCTHYAQDEDDYGALVTLFGPFRGGPSGFAPGDYRPGARASAVAWLAHDAAAELRLMHWGVPPWAERDAAGRKMRPIVNARTEKLDGRFWRGDFEARRCLVPATRFAEWTGPAGARREVWFGARGGDGERPVFAVAGLWREVREPAGFGSNRTRQVFALVTAPANETVAPYHGRMPLVLRPEDHACWLRGALAEALDLATAAPPAANFLRLVESAS